MCHAFAIRDPSGRSGSPRAILSARSANASPGRRPARENAVARATGGLVPDWRRSAGQEGGHTNARSGRQYAPGLHFIVGGSVLICVLFRNTIMIEE